MPNGLSWIETVLIDDALAVEVTRAVGIAGSFIEEMHTLENFREELYMPLLLNRTKRSPWVAEGRRDLAEASALRADELMANPSASPLDEDQKKELLSMTDAFLAELAV